MAEVKYSEVQVGQHFVYKGLGYIRQAHLRAKRSPSGEVVSFRNKRHTIVECENPYGVFSK